MELHSTSKHLSSVGHRNKVAKYEEKWGKNASGTLVADPPSLGLSQQHTSSNIYVVENHAPSNPEYAMMDTDTVSGDYQEYIPSFIHPGTDVGFHNQLDDVNIAAAPLDWEDFLYQRLHVDPVLDGMVKISFCLVVLNTQAFVGIPFTMKRYVCHYLNNSSQCFSLVKY